MVKWHVDQISTLHKLRLWKRFPFLGTNPSIPWSGMSRLCTVTVILSTIPSAQYLELKHRNQTRILHYEAILGQRHHGLMSLFGFGILVWIMPQVQDRSLNPFDKLFSTLPLAAMKLYETQEDISGCFLFKLTCVTVCMSICKSEHLTLIELFRCFDSKHNALL